MILQRFRTGLDALVSAAWLALLLVPQAVTISNTGLAIFAGVVLYLTAMAIMLRIWSSGVFGKGNTD
jgi:hypothetical protein